MRTSIIAAFCIALARVTVTHNEGDGECVTRHEYQGPHLASRAALTIALLLCWSVAAYADQTAYLTRTGIVLRRLLTL